MPAIAKMHFTCASISFLQVYHRLSFIFSVSGILQVRIAVGLYQEAGAWECWLRGGVEGVQKLPYNRYVVDLEVDTSELQVSQCSARKKEI